MVLAAAYMLRMLQKVAYGGTSNPDHSQLRDLGFREIVTLAPLLVFVFWIGLHPAPFHPRLCTPVCSTCSNNPRARPPTYAVAPIKFEGRHDICPTYLAFLPELVAATGAWLIFVVCLGNQTAPR